MPGDSISIPSACAAIGSLIPSEDCYECTKTKLTALYDGGIPNMCWEVERSSFWFLLEALFTLKLL